MVGSAVAFQAKLAALIVELEQQGILRVRSGVSPEDLAQRLADGARGTNQSLAPIAPDQLHLRYRGLSRHEFVEASLAHRLASRNTATAFLRRRCNTA